MSKNRDQRIADETQQYAEHLMCKAHGCPCRWSVDAGNGRLCSSHAWADHGDWPRITQRLIDAEADRAYYGPPAEPKVVPMTREQKRGIGARFREFLSRKLQGGKSWAFALRKREESGAKLTDAQRAMWRAAIGSHAGEDEEKKQ